MHRSSALPRAIRSLPATVLIGLLLFGATCPATASHEDDGAYDQPVLFEWTTTEIDILITSPVDPKSTDRELEVLMASTEVWRDGVEAYGASWLQEALTIRIYAPADDPIPPAGFDDPEIIVTSAEQLNRYSGASAPLDYVVGQSTPANVCVTSTTQYEGWIYGDPIDPTEILGEERPEGSLFNVNAHEVGHCLGLGHVAHPARDIMDDGGPADASECPSNLNIEGLESAFATAAGEPGGGETVTMPVSGYQQIAC